MNFLNVLFMVIIGGIFVARDQIQAMHRPFVQLSNLGIDECRQKGQVMP